MVRENIIRVNKRNKSITKKYSLIKKKSKQGDTNTPLSIESLVKTVPRLVPDEFFKKCSGCSISFTLCRWKYHCRICGLIYCFYCTGNIDNFLPFYLHAIRVCNTCKNDNKKCIS
jgi:hypothetical protein